jgi:HEAT repeat protein
MVLASASLVAAQAFGPGGGRNQLRNRQQPQQQQKADDAIRKFESEDPQERLEGVEKLGLAADDPKAVDYLIRAVSDVDPSIRIKAIDVIGDARIKDATPLLVQHLFMRDMSVTTKQHVLAALGRIGDPRATKPMLDFLARDLDASTRGNAIFALGELGDRAALPALEKLAASSTDDDTRRLAAEAVRRIEQRPAPAVVPPALARERGLPPPDADAQR